MEADEEKKINRLKIHTSNRVVFFSWRWILPRHILSFNLHLIPASVMQIELSMRHGAYKWCLEWIKICFGFPFQLKMNSKNGFGYGFIEYSIFICIYGSRYISNQRIHYSLYNNVNGCVFFRIHIPKKLLKKRQRFQKNGETVSLFTINSKFSYC